MRTKNFYPLSSKQILKQPRSERERERERERESMREWRKRETEREWRKRDRERVESGE